MDVHDEKVDRLHGTSKPDEGWWAAVLADEPQLGEQGDPVVISPVEQNLEKEDNQESSWINWEKIEEVFSNDEIIEMRVVGHNRGGILVAGEDFHGFVPASHLVYLPPDISKNDRIQYFVDYLDQKIAVKVIECNPEKERIVFSERAALSKEGQRKYLLSHLNEGDVVAGTITNVTSFGAFVDLGGIEGLIHLSELSWGRVQHPSDVVNVKDEVKIQVLQVEKDEGRIALSLKRLDENPWDGLPKKLAPGDIVDALITSIVKYGAFACLDEGVEGLIHISSMNFPEGCTKIDDFLYEGQKVKVCIINLEPEKRRLGLKLESC